MKTIQLSHISHEHPLILVEDLDTSSIAPLLLCHLCKFPIIGFSPAYTCSQKHSPCSVFLHKRCAESPERIKHPIHTQIEAGQLVCVQEYSKVLISVICSVCMSDLYADAWGYLWLSYFQLKVCLRCAVAEPVLSLEAHPQDLLTLLRRTAWFECDACGIKSEEIYSYICHTCHYWIHCSCAASPRTIKLQIHKKDTLHLIYSIPELYRNFLKHCLICRYEVMPRYWAYFCEESGYFVHIKCATGLLASGKNAIEKEDVGQITYPNMMQFPRPSTSSLVADLIAEHESGNVTHNNTIKHDAENQKEGSVIYHWSHQEHPLILLEELENTNEDDEYGGDDDDDDDDKHSNQRIDEMLVCDGCIQPISTASNKHYYGCIGCNYFLHTYCANNLTVQSPLGKCTRDPEHISKLYKHTNPFDIIPCEACDKSSNGFMYKCETCDSSNVDICCSLAPHRIKHEYHKHPLVQRETSYTSCNACLNPILLGREYGCEICSDIQIHKSCAMLFPKMIFHRWDSHSIILIYPPIYYKGLRYCEICELEVNQEAWLYSCRECDQYFHPLCIRPHNMKVGHTVDPSTHYLHPHPLTMKVIDEYRYAPHVSEYLSCDCKERPYIDIVFGMRTLYLECTAGCNYVLCKNCANKRLPRVGPEIVYMN